MVAAAAGGRLPAWADACGAVGPSGRRAACGLRLVSVALLLLGAVGALVFWRLERPAELERYHFNRALYASLVDSVAFEHCRDPVFEKGLGYCRQHEELKARLEQFLERAGNSVHDQRLWTPLGSFCFVVNLGSTVGYATQGAPHTPWGQVAAVVFGLVAIPLFGCGFMLAASGLLRQALTLEERLLGPAPCGEAAKRRTLCLAGALLLALWPGAALVFSLLEGWSFSRALFFVFVTFSMVGFGNDVPSTVAGRAVGVAYVYLVPAVAAGVVMRFNSLRDGEMKPLLVTSSTSRPWGCLAAVAAACLLGALVFPGLEREEELQRYERARRMYEDLNALARFSGCDEELLQHMPFCENAESFRSRLIPFFGPDTSNSMVDREAWTPFGSAQFVLSLASTVGYGAHVPHTRWGKVVTVLFGLAAVPAFICYALGVASLIRETAKGLAHNACSRGAGTAAGKAAKEAVASLAVLALLAAGVWLIGSVAFVALEASSRWSFATSLYFCFVTLSGVGFSNVLPRSVAAKGFALVYIFVGLGIVLSLLEELVDALCGHLLEEDAPARGAAISPAAPARGAP